jgi:hypothetical protein
VNINSDSNLLRFAVVLMAVFAPLFNLIGINIEELQRSSFSLVFQPGFGLLILGATLQCLIYLSHLLRKTIGMFVYVGVLPSLFLFFNFKAILEFLISISFWDQSVFFAKICLAILVIVIFLFTAILFKNARYRNFLSIFTSVIFLFSITSLLTSLIAYENDIQIKKQFRAKVEANNLKIQNSPNVYYIIADGLTGPINFERMTGERPGFLSDFARKYGFSEVSDSRSNYLGSASSIASVFHLNYFRTENSTSSNPQPWDYFPAILSQSRKSLVVNGFRSLGFSTFFSGNWYTSCPGNQWTCISSGGFDYNRLSLRIFTNSFAHFLSNKKYGVWAPRVLRRKVDAITPVKKWLSENTDMSSGKFVFIYHMQPHSPWYYDELCQHIVTSGRSDGDLYGKSVKCLVRTMSGFMDLILEKDPEAIVVLHGDHGWLLAGDTKGLQESEWDPKTLFYRSEISNLLRLPERCQPYIKDSIGPMNTMRLIISCVKGEPPEYLEEVLFIPGKNYAVDRNLERRVPPQIK